MGIEALLTALPISGIESQWLASLTGFIPGGPDEFLEPPIYFLEPPAGKSVPYLDPVAALEILFRVEGMSDKDAFTRAVDEYTRLRPELDLLERPILYLDDEVENLRECVPVPRFISFLRSRNLASPNLIDFIEQSCDVTCQTRIFRLHDNWLNPIRLSELPSAPPPKAMIEFFVSLQSDIGRQIAPDDKWQPMPQALFDWRESIKPVAAYLEQVLGKKVYHFQDLDDELDDDCCHRFLALHCWCSLLPESNFVKFLLEVTGFTNVDALKAALIDPASYTHPFTYNDAFIGIETMSCRFKYIPPGQMRRVGIAFRTEAAQLRAKEIALEQIGAEVIFLAPMSLATKRWVKEATRYGHTAGVWSNFDEPIAFLSEVDEIHVVSDENRPNRGFDLNVGAELAVLMWRAHQFGVPMFSDEPAGWVLMNPETCLEECGVPERVAEIDKCRRAYTERLETLVVSADYGSSGLWAGGNVPYDLIDLPFPLIKRIAAWQRNYDDTLIPLLPDTADDDWWKKHDMEGENIARDIQEVLGDKIDVQIGKNTGLVSVKTLK